MSDNDGDLLTPECDQEDGTCDELLKEYPFVDKMTHDEAFQYKYVLDM
jgi:hypothetical protein